MEGNRALGFASSPITSISSLHTLFDHKTTTHTLLVRYSNMGHNGPALIVVLIYSDKYYSSAIYMSRKSSYDNASSEYYIAVILW